MILITESDGAATDARRWFAPASRTDLELLADVTAPVLDIGCGPGRLVHALAARNVAVLGIDIAAGAGVLRPAAELPIRRQSVFDPIPGAGAWRTLLLLDGNVGIGGDPIALLRRLRAVAAPDAQALVELDVPGIPHEPRRVRIEAGNQHGPWFEICGVGRDSIARVAAASGWSADSVFTLDGRWFAVLVRQMRSQTSRS